MNDQSKLKIEPLTSVHDRPGFKCGVDSLDKYIRTQAGQDIKRHISRIYVAVLPDDLKKIIGYYTLSSLSIELKHLPEKIYVKLPKYPIPAALIGRLAVAGFAQGNGIGRMLLADAIKRTMAVSNEIAIYAIVVDAINDKAVSFYRQYGFEPLGDNTLRLFLPLKSTRLQSDERPN